MTTDYDDLVARAESGELAIKPGTVRRGSDASDEARRLLLEATGTTSTEDLTRVALGRPRLGTPAGPSPVVRARVPQALKDRVRDLAEREHRDESDIVREAVAAYVELRTAS